MAEDDYDGPSDQDIEDSYASTWLSFQNELGRERFRDWLAAHDARVARGALDGLIRDLQEKGRCAADSSLPDVSDLAEVIWHAQDEARTYRDRHYPRETP